MKKTQDKISIFGVMFIRQYSEITQMLLKAERTSYTFTPNSEILYMAYKDKNFKNILNSADFLLPDGSGIYLASKIIGTPFVSRTAGIDFGWDILRQSAKSKLKVYLLGGKEGVADLAAKKLTSEIEGLVICGTHHGYFNKCKNSEENREIVKEIKKSEADVVFVCFGAPDQEKWIYENAASLSEVRLFAGLGGSLDVWSGNLKRAPKYIQKAGLEWLWRAISEPKRFKRIPRLFKFLYCVCKEN